MSGQTSMPPSARRAGLDALRAVLRRRNPGLDVVFELEGDDRVDDPLTREIPRPLTTPEDAGPALDRVDVTPTPTRPANHDAVDEPGEDLPGLVHGEAA